MYNTISIISLILSFILIWFNIGLTYNQKEQTKSIEQLAAEIQSFHTKVSQQLSTLDEHFDSINDSTSSLIFELYLSSPLFGIIGGNIALEKYKNILNKFKNAAISRAEKNLFSHLILHFWKEDIHRNKLGYKKDSNKAWFWKEENESDLKQISEKAKEICNIFKELKRNGITVECHTMADDELRFVFLDEHNNEYKYPNKAAIICMSPISGEIKKDDLHGFMILNKTSTGVKPMYEHFKSFKGKNSDTKCDSMSQEIVNSPMTLINRYFNYNF